MCLSMDLVFYTMNMFALTFKRLLIQVKYNDHGGSGGRGGGGMVQGFKREGR